VLPSGWPTRGAPGAGRHPRHLRSASNYTTLACMHACRPWHRRRPAFRPLDESLRGLQKREKGSGLQTNTSYGSLTLYINKGFPTLFNTPNTRLLTATPGTSRAHRMRPHVSTPDRVRPRMPLSDHKYSPRAAYANQKYTRTFRHAHRMRPHVSLPSPPDRVRPRMPLSDHMYMHMYSSETAYTNQNISHTLRHAEGFARHDPSRLSCITPSARVHVSLPSPPNRACRHLTDECRHLTPPNACVPDHHRAPRDPPAVIRAAARSPPPDRVDLPGRTRLTLAPHRSLRHSNTLNGTPTLSTVMRESAPPLREKAIIFNEWKRNELAPPNACALIRHAYGQMYRDFTLVDTQSRPFNW
jgi:hypothetical protein